MIRSLRIRFIRIAVLAVALVLFLIIGSINLLNYRNVAREADTILGILQENDGHFPQGRPVLDMPVPDGETDHAAQDAKLPRRGRTGPFRFDPEQALSEETPFESRYFSVTLDDTGMICGYDISSIASVEESDLEELVQTVTASRKQNGFWNQYRYIQYETDGLTTLLFLDCSRSLYNARS